MREITHDDVEMRHPRRIDEWIEVRRLETILVTRTGQAEHERSLRGRIANWVFGLIAAQLAGLFGLIIAAGFGTITLPPDTLKIVVVAVCSEIVGLGFVVVRYLFNAPLRLCLDALVKGERPR